MGLSSHHQCRGCVRRVHIALARILWCRPAQGRPASTMRWQVILIVAWVVVQLQSAEVHGDEEISPSLDTATTAKQGLPARVVSGGGVVNAPRADVGESHAAAGQALELAQIAKGGGGDATEKAGKAAMKGLIAKKLPAMAAAASAAKKWSPRQNCCRKEGESKGQESEGAGG